MQQNPASATNSFERRLSFNLSNESNKNQQPATNFGSRKSSSNNKPVDIASMASVRNAPTNGKVADSTSL